MRACTRLATYVLVLELSTSPQQLRTSLNPALYAPRPSMTNSVVGGIHWKGLRGGDWNDLLQLLDDGSLANVSGVEYMIDACEMSSNRRIENTMGIGDYADSPLPSPFGRWQHYEEPSFPALTIP